MRGAAQCRMHFRPPWTRRCTEFAHRCCPYHMSCSPRLELLLLAAIRFLVEVVAPCSLSWPCIADDGQMSVQRICSAILASDLPSWLQPGCRSVLTVALEGQVEE